MVVLLKLRRDKIAIPAVTMKVQLGFEGLSEVNYIVDCAAKAMPKFSVPVIWIEGGCSRR